MNDIFFTSDTHFGHRLVAAIRNFATVEEMDETLIQNWNAVVRKTDRVYHCGDFCLNRDIRAARQLADRLNGQIFLIRGNHDKVADHRDVAGRFIWIKDYFFLKTGEEKIVLSHYAHRVWNLSHYGSWHLYGHSHGSLPEDPNARCFDVGVDCWGFAPVDLDTVRTKMVMKQYVPVDHHIGE